MKGGNLKDYESMPVKSALSENIKIIKELMNGSSDLLVNEFTISGKPSALICCEGMVSTAAIAQLIFRPLMELDLGANPSPEKIFSTMEKELLLSTERIKVNTLGDFLRLIMSGFALIITDGMPAALAFGAQGFERRGINPPFSENNLLGSQESFVETIRVNISLVRRKIKSPTLTFKMFQLGSRSKTGVCLVYLMDKVPQKMINEINRKLKKISLETILSGGYVEPFLEGKHSSLFRNIGRTERPDVLCGKLLEGRAALLIDGTPFALIIPYLFIENFQTMDDYSFRPYYAAFLRWLKYFAFFLTILLPGCYVAIATWHPEMFNDILLMNLAAAEETAPMPLMSEALLMLFLYEILREAGLRLPKSVGGAVSLVSGIIIGDAAVSSGIVSTPLLLVVALSVTASFVIPTLNQSSTALRFIFVIAGGVGGLFGISLVLGAVILNLSAMEDFGIPASAPLFPYTRRAMGDVLIRLGFKSLQERDMTIEKLNGVSGEVKR